MTLMKIGDLFELEKGSLQSSKNIEGEYDFITAAEEWKTNNEYSHECEALIFAAAASGSLGRTHYVNGKFITSDLCFIITPKDEVKYPIDLKFYHFVFNSLKEEIVKNTKTGTSKESINQGNLKNYEIPYFGIEQQHLWINRLLNTKSIKETLENEILNQKNLLTKLKQSILQEAIEGKLTAKCIEDNQDIEPVSVLLGKIKAERKKLIKEKKIKELKLLPEINENEIPYKESNSLKWCRISDLFTIEKGQTGIQKAIEGEYPLIVTAEERLSHNEYQFEGEGIIIPMVSSTGHGHASLNRIHYQEGKFAVGSILAVLQPINKEMINSKFYFTYLSLNKDELLVKKMTGAANVTLTIGALSEVIVPYIPYNSQIKIKHLLDRIDTLEQQITKSNNILNLLLQSIISEAFEK